MMNRKRAHERRVDQALPERALNASASHQAPPSEAVFASTTNGRGVPGAGQTASQTRTASRSSLLRTVTPSQP